MSVSPSTRDTNPPSNNTYYRKFRNRMVLSEKGRAYKAAVAKACAQQGLRRAAGRVLVGCRFVAPVCVPREPGLAAAADGHCVACFMAAPGSGHPLAPALPDICGAA